MIYDLQKANMWKRISAYIFDFILLCILAVGFAFLLSSILRYDARIAEREHLLADFEAANGVSFDITQDEYNALTEEERAAYDEAYTRFATDPEVNRIDLLILNLSLLITAFGILIAFLVLELAIPLWLGNGQTLGKKIFGIGVMRVDGVRISSFQLFVRSILGKYTLETMIPILLLFLLAFNVMPLACLMGLLLLLLLQLSFLITSRKRTPIHDMIAGTVTVDIASQMIFESPEELIEYQKKLHAEAAEHAEYR